MTHTRTYKEIETSKIDTAGFNPEKRTSASVIKPLAASIKEHGILSPCTVKKNGAEDSYVMADGHRRLAACRLLEIDSIPCYIDESSMSVEELFMELNDQRKNITPAAWLQVYIKGGRLPANKTRERVLRTQKLVGRAGLVRLAEEGHSPYIIEQVEMASRYCFDTLDRKFMKACFNWLIENNQTYMLRKFFEDRGKASTLVRCVEENKPLPQPRYE